MRKKKTLFPCSLSRLPIPMLSLLLSLPSLLKLSLLLRFPSLSRLPRLSLLPKLPGSPFFSAPSSGSPGFRCLPRAPSIGSPSSPRFPRSLGSPHSPGSPRSTGSTSCHDTQVPLTFPALQPMVPRITWLSLRGPDSLPSLGYIWLLTPPPRHSSESQGSPVSIDSRRCLEGLK